MGYHKAGFDVFGIDIKHQPHYPFDFLRWEALNYLDLAPLGQYSLIHASPPCQAYSWGARKGREDKWPKLIGELRERFQSLSIPYVIENIPNAKDDMENTIMLCGTQFGLRLLKHRLFESRLPLTEPVHNRHTGSVGAGDYVTVAGHGGNSKSGDYSIAAWQEAMGIDWLHTRPELAEAIPPAYTEYIGKQIKELV